VYFGKNISGNPVQHEKLRRMLRIPAVFRCEEVHRPTPLENFPATQSGINWMYLYVVFDAMQIVL
jgi:hypothetical protein